MNYWGVSVDRCNLTVLCYLWWWCCTKDSVRDSSDLIFFPWLNEKHYCCTYTLNIVTGVWLKGFGAMCQEAWFVVWVATALGFCSASTTLHFHDEKEISELLETCWKECLFVIRAPTRTKAEQGLQCSVTAEVMGRAHHQWDLDHVRECWWLTNTFPYSCMYI